MIGLNRILVGDALSTLKRLPPASIDCVVTSPPYFNLRDYQHPGQIGLEPEVDQWIGALRGVASELHRVLVPTGSLWLNLGDSYGTGMGTKNLNFAPERLALALKEDGWLIRNKVVWAKPNPMPSPVRDRLSCTWEVVYLLVKQRTYFFDLDAIRTPHTSSRPKTKSASGWSVPPEWRVAPTANAGLDALKQSGRVGHPLGKNPGDVWRLPTASYRGAHHAVFPLALVERPIRAGCPERRCERCRLPWRRETIRNLGQLAVRGELKPTCECGAAWGSGVVLDPFIGSGTTALVAERLNRRWLGIELNPDFANLADERIASARSRASRPAGAREKAA
jgi:site-specific DNA-methyltransferase (adenine-specific)